MTGKENSNLLYGESLYTRVSSTKPPLCKSFLKNQNLNLKITITLHYICASYRFSASFHAYLRPHSRRAEWAPFHCHRNVTEKKIQGVTPLNAISLWHAHAKEKSAHFRRVLFFFAHSHSVVCWYCTNCFLLYSVDFLVKIEIQVYMKFMFICHKNIIGLQV